MGRKVHESTGWPEATRAGRAVARGMMTSLLFVTLAVTGCAGADDQRRQGAPIGVDDESLDEEGDESASPESVEQAECTDGQTRGCTIKLGQHGTVVTCYRGQQVCSEGTWGPCTDAETPGL